MSTLTFLGTGSAEWNMKTDMYSDEFRAFTSVMLDNNILVDCSAGTILYQERFGKYDMFSGVDTIFITHSHIDHFSPAAIKIVAQSSKKEITVYAHESLKKYLSDIKNITFCKIKPEQQISVHGYEVTVLCANHNAALPKEIPYHYYFKNQKSRIFFGFDGGWLTSDTWSFLRDNSVTTYIIDATHGDDYMYNFRNFYHNTNCMIDLMWETFKQNGVVDKKSKLILTHISKTMQPKHSELQRSVKSKSYTVAYDGMQIKC